MRITTKLALLGGLLAAGCVIPDPMYPEATYYAPVGYSTYGAPGAASPIYYVDGYYWSPQPTGWYSWSNDQWSRSLHVPYGLPHHSTPVHAPSTHAVRTHVPSHGRTHGFSHGTSHGSSHGRSHGGRH